MNQTETPQPSAAQAVGLATTEDIERWRASYRHGRSLTHDELAALFATATAYYAERRRREDVEMERDDAVAAREQAEVPAWAIIEGYQPEDTYDDWCRRECAGFGPDELP